MARPEEQTTDPAAHRTALGALVTGLAATGFAAGIALGSLVPALLGLLLLALGEGARRSLQDPELKVTRRLPKRAHLGDTFTVHTKAKGPTDQPLRVHDPAPAATLTNSRQNHNGRGSAEETQVLTARHPGTIQWSRVIVEVDDPWSFWSRRRTVPLEHRLKVSPEPIWAQAGHLMARRTPSLGRRRAVLENNPSPEIARIREHHPGDRTRDIDWKRSSRSQRLYVRETERKGRRAIHILMDATRPMRWARRHAKATTVLRIVYGTAGLARAAGLPVHLVAYHERGVITERILRPDGLRRALDRLTGLPVPTVTEQIPDSTEPRPPPSEEERRFLASTARLVEGPTPHLPSDEAAIHTLIDRRTPAGLVVAFLDAEADPHGTIAKVRRLAHHGHQVVLVVPPTGAHLYTRQEAEGQVLVRLKEHLTARQTVTHALRPLKVPILLAAPGDERIVLKEVSRRLT